MLTPEKNSKGISTMRIKCISCGKKYFSNSDFCPSCSFPTEQSLREKTLSTTMNSKVSEIKPQNKNIAIDSKSNESKPKQDSEVNEYEGLSYSSQLNHVKRINIKSQLLLIGYVLILLGIFYYFRLR